MDYKRESFYTLLTKCTAVKGMQYEIRKETQKIARIDPEENKIILNMVVVVKVKIGEMTIEEPFQYESEFDLFYEDIHSKHEYIREREKRVEAYVEEAIDKLKENIAYVESMGYRIQT